MTIFFSEYELKKKDSAQTQKGALIKILEVSDWGVADICPHPALGDQIWQEEIAQKGPLFKRSIKLATEDLLARKNNICLLADKKILNNFLTSWNSPAELNLKKYSGQTVKIKADGRIEELAETLNQVNEALVVRLDFNSKLSSDKFERFLSLLSESARRKIEYIEDPTELTDRWKEWNAIVPLASDWQKTDDPSYAKFRIVKPAREEIPISVIEKIQKSTFTSSMDHPVGLAHGLRIAQSLANNVSGFSTLGLYEESDLNRYFQFEDNWLNFSNLALKDYGIGMTEELSQLKWVPLEEIKL